MSLELNPKQIAIINRLLDTGLWGNTPRKVAERVFNEGLSNHQEEAARSARGA